MNERWFVVYNPASGKSLSKNRLQSLKDLFEAHEIRAEIAITKYPSHEEELVQNAISRGFRNLVCCGGDGTLHHMVNGALKQTMIQASELCIAIIPSGTGNDWIKSYAIPTDLVKCLQIMKNGRKILQDIGCIHLKDSKEDRYFVNVAGFGYDAFVVKNLSRFRKLGSLAYLLTGLWGFFSYTPAKVSIQAGSYSYSGRVFMVILGIGKYSGGGMQLTDHRNREEGYFDTTLVPDIGFIKVLLHLRNLYNGRIRSINNVSCFRFRKLEMDHNSGAWIQADGELLGKGRASFHILSKAIGFLVP